MLRTIIGRASTCAVVGLLAANVASAAIMIDRVPVEEAGNLADSNGAGSVSYRYDMGKTEVTAGQYAAFLNAVASVADPNGLYNTNQASTTTGSGIARTFVTDHFEYSVAPAFVNRPVNYVSFWDACRFVNWMQNGQPTGAQDATTTEDGTYTLTPAGIAANSIARATDWRWAVASQDEWYKAAYYNPLDGSYYDYPTSSNLQPGRDLLDAAGNDANYKGGPSDPYPIDGNYYTTPAGQFQNSPSPYGTVDQGGNVWEWTDALVGSSRVLRGGAFDVNASAMTAGASLGRGPATEAFDIGFRVMSVPEPTSLGMFAVGAIGMLIRRRRTAR